MRPKYKLTFSRAFLLSLQYSDLIWFSLFGRISEELGTFATVDSRNWWSDLWDDKFPNWKAAFVCTRSHASCLWSDTPPWCLWGSTHWATSETTAASSFLFLEAASCRTSWFSIQTSSLTVGSSLSWRCCNYTPAQTLNQLQHAFNDVNDNDQLSHFRGVGTLIDDALSLCVLLNN